MLFGDYRERFGEAGNGLCVVLNNQEMGAVRRILKAKPVASPGIGWFGGVLHHLDGEGAEVVEQGGKQGGPAGMILDANRYPCQDLQACISGNRLHTAALTRACSEGDPFCATRASAFAACARSWIG